MVCPRRRVNWLGHSCSKEYKCHGQQDGTLSSARTAHATSNSYARASAHCPTGRTSSKRRLHCALLGPRPPHRAAAGAASPPARPQRPRHFVPQPTLPAPASVSGLGRGSLTIAPRPPHLGRGLGARALAPALSRRSHPGPTHAAAVVPACRAATGAQRPPRGTEFLPARAAAPRRVANGRGRPSRVAEWHAGLLAAHRR
jgi:hypothetical protein